METALHAFRREWFSHPEWWFNARPETDVYLTETYGDWLKASQGEYSMDWTKDTWLAWIVLYDQLPRHMARVSAEHIPLIYTSLSKAIGLVRLVLQEGFELTDYTGAEFGFLLLPMRHSNDCRLIFQVMKLTWVKMAMDADAGNHASVKALKPFLVATYQRCPPLPFDLNEYPDWLQWIPAPQVSQAFPWDTHAPILASSRELLLEGETPMTPTVPAWALGWKLPSLASLTSPALIVSLSGGVDSMVLLWILQTYYPSVSLTAVYINYCNRSDAEEAFVADWCASRGVPLLIRRFREIQRAPAMAFELRDLYESYTKRGRFHTYQLAAGVAASQTSQAFGAPHPPSSAFGASQTTTVAFGHNQDDCFENILTNLCQKKKYSNLRGMEPLMETEGVQCWRPMLQVPKQAIYHFAQQHGIPYLHDSTPKWSCRGKIRDTVRPTLHRFHPAMVPALFHLSDTLAELTDHLEHTAGVLARKTKEQKGTLTVSVEDYPASLWVSLSFWKAYFLILWGFPPSHKSLLHFIGRMRTTEASLRVLLKKGIEVHVRRTATEWVFRFTAASSSLPSSSHQTPA